MSSNSNSCAYVYRTLTTDELIMLYHEHDINLCRYILDNQNQYPKEVVDYCYELENTRLYRQLNTIELDIVYNQQQSPLRPILFSLIQARSTQFHYNLVSYVTQQMRQP